MQSAVFVVWEIRNPQYFNGSGPFAEIGKVWFSESPMFRFAAPTCETRVNTFSYHGTGGLPQPPKAVAVIRGIIHSLMRANTFKFTKLIPPEPKGSGGKF